MLHFHDCITQTCCIPCTVRRKNRENGANATIRIIRVEQVEYCKLIGRSKDPDLRTLAKRGAWYTASVPFRTLFGRDVDEISGNGYNDIGVDPKGDLTVKYCPSSQTLSVTAFVLPCDIYESMYGDELSSLASDDDDDEEIEEDDEGGEDDVISIDDGDEDEDEAAKPAAVASSFSSKSYASKPSAEENKKTEYATYTSNYDVDLESDSDDSLPPSSGLTVGTSKSPSYKASAAPGSGVSKKKRCGSDALPVVSPWPSKKNKKAAEP